MNEAPMTFDARTEIGQYGGDLNTPVALAGYVTFKEGGTQEGINLTSYTDEVGNYASANIVKVNIVQNNRKEEPIMGSSFLLFVKSTQLS